MPLGKLIDLIEDHAEELTERMVLKVRQDPRTTAYHRFDDEELGERARLVYANLGRWLGETSEVGVEEEYFRLGEQRYGERIPLSEFVWALLLTRRNLWRFINSQGWETVSDLERTLDLEILVVRFFDRAILHAVRGYEAAGDGPKASRHPEEAPFWPGG